MGKPSSTRLPKKQHSEVAVSITAMDAKNKKRNRARNRRTKHKIEKLFNQLRNDSNVTINSSNSVLLLDDTIQENVNNSSPSKKRKLSNSSVEEITKIMKPNDSASVIISDDVVLLDNTEPCSSKSNNGDGPKDNDVIITSTGITKSDDVLITKSTPFNSKTPKKFFAPPMNCSTPISKSNTDVSINNNAETARNFNEDNNVTKEINQDSFLTIDLTTETDPNRSSVSKTQFNTVIDLDNTQDSQDCTFVSASNTSLSMSGDSNVTVMKNTSQKRMNKFVNGIAKLNASEKGKLLELITKNIFSGCKIPEKLTANVRDSVNKGTETVENSYIKEVILGQKPSRNSIGSNIYNPGKDQKNKTGLRMIVIDGSNVAMEHGKGKQFSVRGLKICIDYFLKRGHVVKAFVPRFRCKFGKSTEPRVLDDLERRGLVVYTPSREIQGRMITSYDDRYIVQCAAEFDGVIVSGDNYRDLLQENSRWRSVIENRLLPFTWVNDMIMFPRDPLGRNGPTLDAFLRHPVVNPIPSIVL